jgi:hypothetical protein
MVIFVEETVFKPEFENCPRCGSPLKYHCVSPWREVQSLEKMFSARWVIFRCEKCTVNSKPNAVRKILVSLPSKNRMLNGLVKKMLRDCWVGFLV